MILFQHVKINVPNLVTSLDQTPILEWYVVRCDFKNIYQKDIMPFKEIGLSGQDMITILVLTIHIIEVGGVGDLYDHLMSMGIFTR